MASSIPYLPDAEQNPFAEQNEGSDIHSRVSSHDDHDDRHSPEGGSEEADSHHGDSQSQLESPEAPQVQESQDDHDAHYERNEENTTSDPDSGTKAGESTEQHAQIGTEDDENEPLGSIRRQASEGPRTPSGKAGGVKKYKLITKVTGLERQGKKDPIIRFDAYTTLPRFRTTTFRDVRRTYHEFEKFFDHLNGNNPECFVPSLPASKTSAGLGTEEDDQKVKSNLQLWLDRVTSNPILARDEEFVYFIEADFGYSPVVKRKPPATGLARKAMKQLQPPPDEVTELQEFRPLVKEVYLRGLDAQHKLEKVSKHRRSLGLATTDFGTRVSNFASVETVPGMINMWRKLGKVLTSLGDVQAVQATAEASTLGDGLGWVTGDAYVAKEALTNRHLLMRELIKAQATTRARHQTATRVKGSSNLSPVKVDEAIGALEEATHQEEVLTNKVRRVSDNMLLEKGVLLDRFEQDIKTNINNYVLRTLHSERRALSYWESVRLDIRAADSNGGLSRLGRESTPANRRATIAQSQGARGDSWSGDRHRRATDYGSERRLSQDHDEDHEEISQEDTIVDARNAASLLAGSVF